MPSTHSRYVAASALIVAVVAVCSLPFAWNHFQLTSGDGPTPSSHESDRRKQHNSIATVTGTVFQSSPTGLDPQTDQWPSEVFAAAASRVLDDLKTLAVDGQQAESSLAPLFSPGFSVTVNGEALSQVYSDQMIAIWRFAPNTQLFQMEGKDGASTFLRAVWSPEPAATGRRLTMKIMDVAMGPSAAATTVRVEANWRGKKADVQQTSHWRCHWELQVEREPRMASAQLQAMNRVERKGKPWFADCTHGVLGHTAAFRQQLSHGLGHWLARVETAHGMNYFSKHGLAVGDVNGDGLDDLYVCQPGGVPNRLFLQSADGTAIERSQEFEVDLLDRTASALLVDLDNDGDQDLAMATIMGVQLFENVDQQRFQHRLCIPFPDNDLQGLSAVDYDHDGDLDLYQIVDYASHISRARQGLPSFVYHNANDGGANRLLQNNISNEDSSPWQFRDVTRQVGLQGNNSRHSLAAAWEDYDNDGDQDLYVANDYGPNCLYRNEDGHFVEIAADAGVTDLGSGMSVSWGDYDRDGHIDLYVGNMFSFAGKRITSQRQFLPDISEAHRVLYRRFAKGNSLFHNSGVGRFQETGAKLGVEMGRWAWSSLFADINNDGWEDLLVANGYLTTLDTGDL